MNRKNVIILVAVVGLSTGIVASYLDYSSESVPTKCEEIEQQAKERQSFNGTLTCYPPGVIEVNVSSQLGNKTNLDCVCKKENDGNVQYFPILSTGEQGNQSE